MQFEFALLEWSAYADGLHSRADWLAWARGAAALPQPVVTRVPQLAQMPALMRRRVERLGRLACQTAYWCQGAAAAAPMVFASRYGDAQRSLALLGELAQGRAPSPAGFALSVHNAIAALYSIARSHTGNTVVVAAGRATALAALTEAAALLADGAPELLLVCYDAPLPGAYAEFEDGPACEYAWAWRLARPESAAAPLLQLGAADWACASAAGAALPAGLGLLRCMLRSAAAAAAAQLPAQAAPGAPEQPGPGHA